MEGKTKKRCSFEGCNKKLKIISFGCQCGGEFCPTHRYMNAHNCPNIKNKKNTCKEILKENNPEINFNKVVKI